MPYLGDTERQRLERVQLPGGYKDCVGVVRNYLARADMSAADLAERVGKGRSTVNLFIQGRWDKHTPNWKFLAAHLIEFINRNPIEVAPAVYGQSGRLFETENFRRIRKYFVASIERGEVCLLYGPPGTQKTFALSHLIAERNREKKPTGLYVYASQGIAPLPLLKRIGRAAGVLIGWQYRDRILENLLFAFRKAAHPPAIVVDEAQHMGIESLEFLRELHDRSGCGLVLAGSHNLYENFLRGRAQLEQWLSRIDHKDPLPGLLESEVHKIAARELGNGQPAKLSERQLHTLVAACQAEDIFARGADGKPCPGKYLSVRRLVKVLAQHKEGLPGPRREEPGRSEDAA